MPRLGDGGHLAEEPQVVQAPLLRCRPLGKVGGTRRPRDLGDDPMKEFLDAGRRRFRLLALHADQRRLVLLVGEIDLRGAAGDQHPSDEADDDDDVLPEQPAPPAH